MERKLRELQQRRAAEEAAAAKAEESDGAGSSGNTAPSRTYTPTLHRGSFREAHEENMSLNQRASKQSKAAFWVVLLLMLGLLYWLL